MRRHWSGFPTRKLLRFTRPIARTRPITSWLFWLSGLFLWFGVDVVLFNLHSVVLTEC